MFFVCIYFLISWRFKNVSVVIISIYYYYSVNIQGDSVARGPKLLSINSLGPLATESPCITTNEVFKIYLAMCHYILYCKTYPILCTILTFSLLHAYIFHNLMFPVMFPTGASRCRHITVYRKIWRTSTDEEHWNQFGGYV